MSKTKPYFFTVRGTFQIPLHNVKLSRPPIGIFIFEPIVFWIFAYRLFPHVPNVIGGPKNLRLLGKNYLAEDCVVGK